MHSLLMWAFLLPFDFRGSETSKPYCPLKHQQPLAYLAVATPCKSRVTCVSPWKCREFMIRLLPRHTLSPQAQLCTGWPLGLQARLGRAVRQASLPPGLTGLAPGCQEAPAKVGF